MSEQFSNTEQGLIERLRRAPQPELPPEAREIIRARVLDALNHPPLPAPRPTLLSPVGVIAAVLIAAALITGIVLFVLSRQNQTVPPPIVTIQPTVTALSTLTPSPTLTALPTTAVPVIVSSPVMTASPTLTPTVEIALTPTPLPTATINTVTVIQGPVEHIDGNILTIYGIPIQVDPDNPILKTVVVGDVLRIEGNQTRTPIVIVATTIIPVNVPSTVSTTTGPNANPPPSSGEVWQDDGSCANPPPDWAPANGWRRRCQGQDKNKDNGNGNKDDDD